MDPATLLLLLGGAAGVALTALVLAWLARRIHPGLSLLRLWLFYCALLGAVLAAVFLLVFA